MDPKRFVDTVAHFASFLTMIEASRELDDEAPLTGSEVFASFMGNGASDNLRVEDPRTLRLFLIQCEHVGAERVRYDYGNSYGPTLTSWCPDCGALGKRSPRGTVWTRPGFPIEHRERK